MALFMSHYTDESPVAIAPACMQSPSIYSIRNSDAYCVYKTVFSIEFDALKWLFIHSVTPR